MNVGTKNGVSPYLIGVAVVLSAFFALRAAINPYMLDDTLITFQYVRSATELGALVWHGELPAVDGYTSLGHVLLLWAGVAAGLDIVLANTFVATFSMLLIVWLFIRTATALGYPLFASTAGLFVICMNAGFIFWFSAGMEAVLYAAIFFLVYVRYEAAMARGRLSFGDAAALVALGLVRPEGCFIALALAGFFVAVNLARRIALRPSVAPVALAVLAICGIFLWRQWVYGHPFPNTYYAKASASRMLELSAGYHYALNWFTYFGGALVAVSLLHTAINPRNYLRLLFVVGQIVLVVVAGGDPHPEMRFMLPIIPLIALDLSAMLVQPERGRRVAALLLFAAHVPVQFPVNGAIRLALVKQAFYMPTFPDVRKGYETIAAGEWPFASFENNSKLSERVGRAAGLQLGQTLNPGVLVGGADVGALAYFSGLPVLDANGLNHQVIAHLPKPEGRENVWGFTRFDQVVADGAEAINISFPRYSNWNWDDLAAGADQCQSFERYQLRLIRDYEKEIAEKYVCVSAPAMDREGAFLNILVDRDKIEKVFAVETSGLDISDCLPEFRKICEPE